MKIVLGLLGVVVLAVGGFLAFVALAPLPHYEQAKLDLKVDVTPERVARGKKLASVLCLDCHFDGQTGKATGRDMKMDAEFGSVHSYNITQHPTKGIGSWTDAEIAVLLRTGTARDGRYTPPWMMKVPHMADEDLASIIAYLRSDAPELQPADVASIPAQPNFFSKLLGRVAFGPLPMPSGPIVVPPASDPVALGRYLVFNLDCWTCHSPDFTKMNSMQPELTPGYLSGGNKDILTDDGVQLLTPNLTPDATGLAAWTEDEFVKTLRDGVRKDGTPLQMLTYSALTEEELKAIWAYLRQVPAIANVVKKNPPVSAPAQASAGEQLFFKYACVACHSKTGNGMCDLTHNRQHFATDEGLTEFIKNPRATMPNTTMPSWGGVIPDAELAQLVPYVRSLDKH